MRSSKAPRNPANAGDEEAGSGGRDGAWYLSPEQLHEMLEQDDQGDYFLAVHTP